MNRDERENKLRQQIILYSRQNKRLKKIEIEIIHLKKELASALMLMERKVKGSKDKDL